MSALTPNADDWQPTCSIAALKQRAALLDAIRRFFRDEGYLEVETPLLASDVVVDAHIDPFRIERCAGEPDLFLQTSPEAAMKRLLAAGSGSVFQITRSFRQGEQGAHHNSEFTIVEWYSVGLSFSAQMDFTERLVRSAAQAVANAPGSAADGSIRPAKIQQAFSRSSYDEVFVRHVGCSALEAPVAELERRLNQVQADEAGKALSGFDFRNRDDLLNLMLAEYVEPRLGTDSPEFVHDYPVSQAALAKQNPDDPRTALRFELYIDGTELCNGYEELTEADVLTQRRAEQNGRRAERRESALPGALRMEAAMRAGLPKCSGVALGFDRLLMVLGGYDRIQDVIPFPMDRA